MDHVTPMLFMVRVRRSNFVGHIAIVDLGLDSTGPCDITIGYALWLECDRGAVYSQSQGRPWRDKDVRGRRPSRAAVTPWPAEPTRTPKTVGLHRKTGKNTDFYFAQITLKILVYVFTPL